MPTALRAEILFTCCHCGKTTFALHNHSRWSMSFDSCGSGSDEDLLRIGVGGGQDVIQAHRNLLGYWIVLCAQARVCLPF
jgi:hypothetical protein